VVESFEIEPPIYTGRMAFDPETRRLFVPTCNCAEQDDPNGLFDISGVNDYFVTVVDMDTREVISSIQVGARPWGVGVDSKEGVAFVFDSEGIAVIDTATLGIVDRFSVGAYPRLTGQGPLTVDEDGGMLFAVNESWGTVTVVNTATGEVIDVITCGDDGPPGGPYDIAVDPTARRAYITGCKDMAVAVVDLETLNVIETLRPADTTATGSETLGFTVEVDPATGSVFFFGDGGVVTVTEGR
jgi:YVTN family beta-propeller protein